MQKVAVTEKSEACEALLVDITAKTTEANEKKELAEKKSVDIEEQNKVIAVEKVMLWCVCVCVCVCVCSYCTLHTVHMYIQYVHTRCNVRCVLTYVPTHVCRCTLVMRVHYTYVHCTY